MQKADLPETRDNDTIARKVHTEINFALEKNGGYMSSSIGSRSISVGSEWVSEWVSKGEGASERARETKSSGFDNLNLLNSKV